MDDNLTLSAEDESLRGQIHLLMLGMGITAMVTEYDGGGDDGSTYFSHATCGGKDLKAESVKERWPDTGKQLLELFDDLAYKVLDAVPFDWVNNDGGFGRMKMDEKGKVSVRHNQRFTETHLYDYSL